MTDNTSPAEALGEALAAITDGLAALDAATVPAVTEWLETMDHAAVVETVDWLQRKRAEMARLEAYIVRELGRDDTRPEAYTLPDGRTAELGKAKDRKEWRHADWQRDVRAAVVRHAGIGDTDDLVNATTGERVQVYDLLASIQAVHASAAPKVTALKALDLSADDYCTSYPGPWSLRIQAPAPASPTTTERTV